MQPLTSSRQAELSGQEDDLGLSSGFSSAAGGAVASQPKTSLDPMHLIVRCARQKAAGRHFGIVKTSSGAVVRRGRMGTRKARTTTITSSSTTTTTTTVAAKGDY